MFQNLASYLLGSIVSQNQEATAEGVENNNQGSVRLTTVEQDDDWLLVDRDSEGNSDASSEDELDDGESHKLDTILLPVLLTRSSSTSSLPCTSNMEESWFITPPPCFTSTGPIQLETSPLENLLIEHPSMSVYQHTHPSRRHITVTVPVRTVSPASSHNGHDGDLEDGGFDGEEQVAVVQNGAPRLNCLHVLQQQERQRFKSKRAQKAQVQRACQAFKQGYLERSNKAREVNGRNRRQRRGERSQGATRSYANNNRKC